MKKILFAVAAVASLGAFAAVPFKIGIAGYTFHKKNVDQTIAAMKELDLHSLCVKDFHLKLDCTQDEADAFKAGYSGNCNIEYERDFDDNMAGLLESVGYYRGVADTIKVKAKMTPAPEGANTLAAAEKADGWVLAWDGKTFDGWLAVKSGCKAPPEKGWVIKDGTLTMRPVNGIASGNWFPLPPED